MNRPTRATPSGRAYLDLQNRARAEDRSTQALLTLYVVERWLARLGMSPYSEHFVLKGGMLLAAFDARRPTADVDALARDFPNDEETVVRVVVAVANMSGFEDGVAFYTETVRARVIRDTDLYAGVRITMGCAIASARVTLRLDVNFGDPITPGPQHIDLPALRPGQPPIRVLGYPLETVLAEKIATAIALGPANSRVRDYADIYTLIQHRTVAQPAVRQALVATAAHRGTALVALSAAVADLVDLRGDTYAAYRRGLGPDATHLPSDFSAVVNTVVAFADGLVEEASPATSWDGAARRWVG